MNFKFTMDTTDELNKIDKLIINNIIDEKTNEQIALLLDVTLGTIKRRIKRLFRLYGVKSRIGLIIAVAKRKIS